MSAQPDDFAAGQFAEQPCDRAGYRRFTATLGRFVVSGTVIAISRVTSGIDEGEPLVPRLGVALGRHMVYLEPADAVARISHDGALSSLDVPDAIPFPAELLAHHPR